jgi:hypothetical protein
VTPIVETGASGYTFKELREEAAARGFTDMLDEGVEEKRLGRYVNQAYREIADLAPWPFLQDEVEGPAPLELPEFGHVLSASNLTADTPLYPLDERQVTGIDPVQGATGTAEAWFLAGLSTLSAWPLDTASTLRVKYVKQPAALVEDGDEALIPVTYQDLIVDGAEVRCQKKRKNYEAAQFIRQEWRLGIEGMRHALLKPNYDQERSVARTGDHYL